MRPRLTLPWTKVEKWYEWLAPVGLVAGKFMIVWAWNSLPDRIPSHYNLAGEVDAYGDKSTLLILVGVMTILWLGLTVLSHYPHICNYPIEITRQNAERQYRLARQLIIFMKMVVTILFAGIIWHIILTAQGYLIPVWPVIGIPTAVVIGSPIWYLVKATR